MARKTPPSPDLNAVAKTPRRYGLAKQNRPATPAEVQARAKMLVSENGTLLATAKKLGVNVGYLSQIIRGKRRASNKVLAILGLPCYAPAVVCPVHGVVHQGRCPRPKTAPRSLFDWPVKRLALAIRNRK